MTTGARPALKRSKASRRSSPRCLRACIQSSRASSNNCANPRQAQAQRRIAAVRAGSLAGAGIRIPLRLPRSSAHGHRAGAPGARVRHGTHHHGADGGVRGVAEGRFDHSRREPSKLPDLSKIEEIREPIITATIFLPQDYVGPVITLCNLKRGMQVDMRYHGRQVQQDTTCR